MDISPYSTNVITKSNVNTSTNLLVMFTQWPALEAHLAWHTASYVWEVMVKSNGSTTTYVGGLPVTIINNPPDCLQQNTIYYMKANASGYSFHTTVANADADIKIDFVAGEMGTGTTFNLIFIRKNYTQNTPNGGSVKLNRFIAEPLGEMACCYKDTFENMTKATFYFPPAGIEITLTGGVGMGEFLYQQPGATSFAPKTTLWTSTPIAGTPVVDGGSGYYTVSLYRDHIHISWGINYWDSADLYVTSSALYTGFFSASATWPQFGSGNITYHTPLVIPDLRLFLPDAYFFVATGHHISLGTIDTTLTYDRPSGCYVSDVFNYYNIPGRMWFEVELVPRDYGGAIDWLGSALTDVSVKSFSDRLWLQDPNPSNPGSSYDTWYNSGPLAIPYSYYQRARKSRFTAFSDFHAVTSTGHPSKGFFKDDLRDSAFWQGADRFAIRSDSGSATISSIDPAS